MEIQFAWVRVRGNRAFVSGHVALTADGSPAGPFGNGPSEVTLQEAQHPARLAVLDRVSAWLMVNAYVNAEPSYPQTAAVMDPFSEFIINLYGTDAGSHPRTAIEPSPFPSTCPS